ncbi:hypothetical protein [Campylobacter sp. MIT 97-5078]|uniref:hypothetical protein n=1 Tax=Campylobacter sp. MIT 97-5078 TaxID=1548153 RepID=UPI000512B39B|nr:hypothetical protein [Campylobacter sp. MIT 97-5078]KGI56756.1 hypothetical protein LR59_05940 [Campylobacter sp. MIT 97-5078]KGI57227.1 hypothetical protein LR59_00310 [Campylobacter sp. MIT 97-5078]TQR27608.1 hypothetical protein DMB91_03170 [Campylobacter sp. MIT 97-5078]
MKVDNFIASFNANTPNLYNANASKAFKKEVEPSKTQSQAQEDAEFDKALKEQTDAFEAFLIKTVLDISMKNKASIFEKDASDDIYTSMYNDTMSKALSGGMGFSQLLFNFLKERA